MKHPAKPIDRTDVDGLADLARDMRAAEQTFANAFPRHLKQMLEERGL